MIINPLLRPADVWPSDEEVLERLCLRTRYSVWRTAGIIKLTLPYAPPANVYWRVSRGTVHVSAEAKQYKARVLDAAMRCGPIEPLAGPVILTLDVYRPQKSGDLSNRIKVCEDALIGIAYADDKQVVEIHARRFDSKENPRIEVTITEAKP